MSDYRSFLARKSQQNAFAGFEPVWLPDFLHGFQRASDEWAVRKGRCALYYDCGLGKTPMFLVWAENVVRHTNRPVLVVTPLGVSAQTIREAEKFGVDAVRSRDGKFPAGARLVVTNYERLHYFNPSDFAGIVCDESGGIKHFDADRTASVIEFARTLPYRLLCTATAAPNDYIELGTSAEALGEMGYADMVTRFFKQRYIKDFRGWSRQKYDLRPHAARDFWRWVVSWSRACRKPSDLGFDDGPFVLPPLLVHEYHVRARTRQAGVLFDLPAVTMDDVRRERRRTLAERCEKAAELVAHNRPAVCWCNLNPEGDLLTRLIPGAVQVSGSDADEAKEEKLSDFLAGRTRVLVTKPVLFGWGLNLQHCADTSVFPTDSFESYYQLIRRFWRFGQTRTVNVHLVLSEGEGRVMANLERKGHAADAMFSRLVANMNDVLSIDRHDSFTRKPETPAWLSSSRK